MNKTKKYLGVVALFAIALSLSVFFHENTVFSKANTTTQTQTINKKKLKIKKVISSIIEKETLSVPQLEKKKKKKKKVKLTKIEKYEKTLFDLGVTDLSDSEDDCLKIHKEPNSKSKVSGYLADGATMTIIEEENNWYKIKSDKIKGYVKTKYVLVDDDAEDYIKENKYVSAHVTKASTLVLSRDEKTSPAVGMGYMDADYPIIQFSDNQKYAYIERTETISGWVLLSNVDIDITAPKAMTLQEFEEYQKELERKEQEALNSYLNLSVGSTGNKLQDSIINLIAHNESGNFKAAANPKFKTEKTITVGAWQWYGENAHEILRLIIGANSKKAKKILESAFTGKKAKDNYKKLYNDIMDHDNWESKKRIFSKQELIAIKELLGSDQGVKLQNTKIKADIQSKMKVAINTYKLKDDKLTAYFCDMFWQSPVNAKKVVAECIKHYKSSTKFSKAKDNLKYMHETAIKNSVFKKFANRRKNTYSYCKKLAS